MLGPTFAWGLVQDHLLTSYYDWLSGHTFAWGLGQDHLLTPCYDYYGKPDGFFGPINPILKSTYKFLDGLFREVMHSF